MTRVPTSPSVPRMRPLSSRKPTIVSVLDVGSSKVSCIIARLSPRPASASLPGRTHDIQVLGYGMQRARGMKSGVVIDLEQAEHSIRLAVDAAERMADLTIESLIVSLSAGRLRSEVFRATVDVAGLEVDDSDIQRVLAAGGAHSVTEDRALVHSLPTGYALDGARGISEPRGMLGETLSVDMHIVTADAAPIRNLELAVNRCHLSVETMVAAPYASGLSTLVDDEANIGCACVDMGGGTTSIAVFADGHFCHADAIAIGGQHVTSDIARGLSTRMQDAERIKTLHGSALATSSDEHEMVGVPSVGDDTHDIVNIPRGSLTRIIRPRIEEMLELVRDRLAASGHAGRVGKRVVLTGGASQLTGLVEVARRILGRNVRLGRPLGISGLPQAAKGPAFAAAVGLLIYPQVAQIEQFRPRSGRSLVPEGSYLSRVGQWLKEAW
jgi:cell division protein FtsA